MAAFRVNDRRDTAARELERRLPWLLVFRAVVATILLVLTLVADLRGAPIERTAPLLYAVVVGSYLVVVVLGLALRARASAPVLAASYLAFVVMAAFMVVQATGVIDSEFSFLYVLGILDAAIIGARSSAFVVATASALAYGGQLVLQRYGWLGPVPRDAADWEYSAAVVGHLAAFYLEAWLAGYLANLLRRAREAVYVAEGDLRLAHELRGAILEALPLAVITFDEDRRMRTANAGAARLLGVPAQELVGRALPEDIDALLRDAPGAPEVQLRDRIVSVRSSSLPGPSPLEVLVIEDRTEVERLARRVEAQTRLASLGEMAAGIAHEIRNPLAAISGSLELIALNEGDPESVARLRSIVMREVERLNGLVTDFLAYARPAPADRALIDVATLARELCEVLRSDPSWAGHPLHLSSPERLTARVDPGQLRQMLWNLLRNAREASPRDAPVDLVMRQGGNAGLVVEIRDRGPGIDPAMRDHLFEPFRTTKQGGSGLGLAIVHRIVENHGGVVELEPADVGTVARVRI